MPSTTNLITNLAFKLELNIFQEIIILQQNGNSIEWGDNSSGGISWGDHSTGGISWGDISTGGSAGVTIFQVIPFFVVIKHILCEHIGVFTISKEVALFQ